MLVDERRGYPANKGTSGRKRKLASGKAPGSELDDTKSQLVAATLASESEASSVWVSDGPLAIVFSASKEFLGPGPSSDGRKMETTTVISCSAAIVGQMRKTNGAGVTSVEKKSANCAFVVGPTQRVMTEASVAIGMRAFGSCMVLDTRPK